MLSNCPPLIHSPQAWREVRSPHSKLGRASVQLPRRTAVLGQLFSFTFTVIAPCKETHHMTETHVLPASQKAVTAAANAGDSFRVGTAVVTTFPPL